MSEQQTSEFVKKMKIENSFKSKILGCWMGKNIGGTLGAPMEWKREANDVTFYLQDLKGEPVPNDDLDIQLLWLTALEEYGPDLTVYDLASVWQNYVTPHWAEYGNAKVNMRMGLVPPFSGINHNVYKDSCGAFIRSEIWACIAPGDPHLAVKYAYNDAIIDHGDGEGMYAEVFCAAVQSAAFIESDILKLIDIGMSYIPEDCGVAKAIREVFEAHKKGLSPAETRDIVLKKHRGRAYGPICEADIAKGFLEGRQGYDVPSNIAIIMMGLLYGEGDFSKTLCIAVNQGEDTDCTAATLGALWGIIHGIEKIPSKWIEPIGTSIKTISLNLGDLFHGFGKGIAGDIENLTDRVITAAQMVAIRNGGDARDHVLSENYLDKVKEHKSWCLYCGNQEKFYRKVGCAFYETSDIKVTLQYAGGFYILPGEKKKLKLYVENKRVIPAALNFKLYTEKNVNITPAENMTAMVNHC